MNSANGLCRMHDFSLKFLQESTRIQANTELTFEESKNLLRKTYEGSPIGNLKHLADCIIWRLTNDIESI